MIKKRRLTEWAGRCINRFVEPKIIVTAYMSACCCCRRLNRVFVEPRTERLWIQVSFDYENDDGARVRPRRAWQRWLREARDNWDYWIGNRGRSGDYPSPEFHPNENSRLNKKRRSTGFRQARYGLGVKNVVWGEECCLGEEWGWGMAWGEYTLNLWENLK